jgi:hypothetical protein
MTRERLYTSGISGGLVEKVTAKYDIMKSFELRDRPRQIASNTIVELHTKQDQEVKSSRKILHRVKISLQTIARAGFGSTCEACVRDLSLGNEDYKI